jgi:hypothetical protein
MMTGESVSGERASQLYKTRFEKIAITLGSMT